MFSVIRGAAVIRSRPRNQILSKLSVLRSESQSAFKRYGLTRHILEVG